jgi:hypothetical protein
MSGDENCPGPHDIRTHMLGAAPYCSACRRYSDGSPVTFPIRSSVTIAECPHPNCWRVPTYQANGRLACAMHLSDVVDQILRYSPALTVSVVRVKP